MAAQRSRLWYLQRLHAALDERLVAIRHGIFVSDWNGTHPLTSRFLGSLGTSRRAPGQYATFDEDSLLTQKIVSFHNARDITQISRNMVVAGQGASSLITALGLWLREMHTEEVFYIPPIYFTFGYILELLQIRARPVSGFVPFASRFSLNLPPRRTTLILSDPVWFAGYGLPNQVIAEIRSWQKRTGSLVIVDGAFQYLAWSVREENTSGLASDRTVRLICPTKALALHGYRFAYLLVPSRNRKAINHAYENCNGSASIDNLAFSHRAMDVLSSPRSNTQLIDLIKRRYGRASGAEAFSDIVSPDSGYFIFGKLKRSRRDLVSMGPEYFQVRGYNGFIRVNLLNTDAFRSLLN
jgi:aspartate/methionine/tyrosine aminotransferase